MMLGLSLGLCGPRPTGTVYTTDFDPATLPLSWWGRGAYTHADSASPMIGVASAGTSGNKTIGYNGSAPTRTGYALNGIEGEANEGFHNSLFDDNLNAVPPRAQQYTMGDFVAVDGWYGNVVCKPGTPNDDEQGAADEYPTYSLIHQPEPNLSDPIQIRYLRGIWADGGKGIIQLTYGYGNVYLTHHDGGSMGVEGGIPVHEIHVPLDLEEVALLQYGYDGTKMWLQKNGETAQEKTVGPLYNVADYLLGGGTYHEADSNLSTAHFGGVIWERMVSKSNLRAQIDNIREYYSARFQRAF